jgi:hypothetical protein
LTTRRYVFDRNRKVIARGVGCDEDWGESLAAHYTRACEAGEYRDYVPPFWHEVSTADRQLEETLEEHAGPRC